MRCTIVLEFDDGEGSEVKRIELMRLHRDTATLRLVMLDCRLPKASH